MKKIKKLQRELGNFVQQYGRKKRPGWDPNDRNYDRKIEEKLKKMDPEELDELLHGDLDEQCR